ncbi:MAG: hypothetical protein ABSC71_20225 [Candidatus Acidiferrales bacterium]|jgi:hypothetical protein
MVSIASVQDAVDRRGNVQRSVIVEDQVRVFGSLGWQVEPDDILQVAARRPGVNALGVSAFQFIDGNPKVDLAIVADLVSIPTMHFVEKGDGGANHVETLLGQKPAKPGVSQCRSQTILGAVAKVLRDCGAQDVPV